MKIYKLFKILPVIVFVTLMLSCNEPENIVKVIYNRVSAKERLDSAIAQATRKYGNQTKLVLIFGSNVIFEGADKGKTDIAGITALSDPNNLGAWIYIFKKTGTDTLAVFTPNPVPGAKDCIELTKYFNLNTIINLIADTSARNIISGALALINNINFNITTATTNLVDSDVSLEYANSSNPVIKFDSSFIPSASSLNGNYFFNNNITGATKTVNMFLIPGLGSLNLPQYITGLTGFPPDLWIVNYKKTFNNSITENLVLATVVENNQIMTIPYLSLSSKVINLSKFINR
ncbi:MAG: hypothetical protein N2490_07080 [Ignavibacteria bacterium]|nr:hypothetical protein [Ignavibacteria bacterium]